MSQPADSGPALTVRDEPATTRRDVPDLTVRDEALPPRTLMQLPSALAGRYRIVQPLPTAGGEARAIALKIVIIWIFLNLFFDIYSKDIGKNNQHSTNLERCRLGRLAIYPVFEALAENKVPVSPKYSTKYI